MFSNGMCVAWRQVNGVQRGQVALRRGPVVNPLEVIRQVDGRVMRVHGDEVRVDCNEPACRAARDASPVPWPIGMN